MASEATAFEDWDITRDSENIREGSIELQRVIHRRWLDKIVQKTPEKFLSNSKLAWRVACLEKLEVALGRPISGRVLEIGAGTAMVSCFASKRTGVTEVVALDYDSFCVEEMMPVVFEKYAAEAHKIKRVLGSYNKLGHSNYFDVVAAVGALHHSEDLLDSLKMAHDVLKPGGVMLISDVCEYDYVSQKFMHDRYEQIDPDSSARYGRDVKIKDNGDHWYRLSEWISCAYGAGFDVAPLVFDPERGQAADDGIFRDITPYDGFSIRVFQPYFGADGQYDRLVLILQRPFADGTSPLIASKSLPTQGEAPAPASSPPKADLERGEEGQDHQRTEISELKGQSKALRRKLESARDANKKLSLRNDKLIERNNRLQERIEKSRAAPGLMARILRRLGR